MQVGFVISLALVLIAFEWTSSTEELSKMAKVEETEFDYVS